MLDRFAFNGFFVLSFSEFKCIGIIMALLGGWVKRCGRLRAHCGLPPGPLSYSAVVWGLSATLFKRVGLSAPLFLNYYSLLASVLGLIIFNPIYN